MIKQLKARKIAVSLILPPLLFILLKPELYGLLPNGLDPVFYTGYAINFSDLIKASGDNHYFVSRWTAYGPTALLQYIVGIDAARLLVRWIWASLIVIAVLKLAPIRKLDAKIFAAGMVVTMPIFVRAFFTDYTESTFVPALVLMAIISMWGDISYRNTLIIGILAAIAIIANVFSLIHIFPISLMYAARVILCQESIIKHILLAIVVSSLIAGAGWLYFFVFHGFYNVYEPTVRFALLLKGKRDPLLSPGMEWLLQYSWVFLPILLSIILTFKSIYLTGSGKRSNVYIITSLLWLGILIQWADQFIRGGSLEIPYYWSFGYWIIVVSLLSLIGLFSESAEQKNYFYLFLSLMWVLLLYYSGTIALPGGYWLIVALVSMLFVILILVIPYPTFALSLTVLAVATVQVFPPDYKKTRLNPQYSKVFNSSEDNSETSKVYRDVKWFTYLMQQTPNAALTVFCQNARWGSSIIATYAPHVTGRLLNCRPQGVTDEIIRRLRFRNDSQFAVLGDHNYVIDAINKISTSIEGSRTLLIQDNSPGYGYSLGVLGLPSVGSGPVKIISADMYGLIGKVSGSNRFAHEGDHREGFLNYGPYIRLSQGSYRLKIAYRSTLTNSESSGWADVFSNENQGARRVVNMYGTNGDLNQQEISFNVRNDVDLYEFRTYWNGRGTLDVSWFELQRMSPSP